MITTSLHGVRDCPYLFDGQDRIAVMRMHGAGGVCDDYHFWRKRPNGEWEDKPGFLPARQLPGHSPLSPADRGGYNDFCGEVCF